MISSEQNSPSNIELLAAQRQLYATSKKVFGWQMILCGPLPVAGALLVIQQPQLKAYFAAWGILVALCDHFVLTPWQKALRNKAAHIQEKFDCTVLQLPWNDLKAGKSPDPELIKEQSDKYQSWAHEVNPLENWYPAKVDELPFPIARIVCQRVNCWWDSEQRRKYAGWIVGLLCSLLVILGALALTVSINVGDFLLICIAPVAPAVLIGLRQFREHTEAAERLDKLKEHSVTLWKAALAGEAESIMTGRSRNLQDEILESRKKAPPVLDLIFRRLRKDYERRMKYSADQYVAEAKAALNIK